jgi:hypothetical protein
MRLKILRWLNFIPDKMMIRLQYFIKMGHRLNLKTPKRFTEKLQWYKLYYRIPLMAQCSDKAEVRNYVASKGLSSILNKVIGIYNSVDEINFNSLPNKFVAKDTLGGGGNAIIICTDKTKLNIDSAKRTMQEWLNTPKYGAGREWVYNVGKSRIIIEKYIESNPDTGGLIDYKFFCFNGKVEFLYVVADRKIGENAGIGIYSSNFTKLNVFRSEKQMTIDVVKPKNFNRMIEISTLLSADFPHVRVDLYNVDGKIIFGELTFFNASGYMTFTPDEFDFEIGEKFILPEERSV